MDQGDDTYYGFDRAVWQRMVEKGVDFLRDEARLGRTTTYTEFCTVISQRAETDIETGTYALPVLLTEISDAAAAECGALITCLVLYLDKNEPGEGFFRLAQEKGLLPAGQLTPEIKDRFWTAQVAKVQACYRPS